MPSVLRLGVTVALSATGLLAHPLSHARRVSKADDLLPEYDYVVVGAGASGLTVANRLSEEISEHSYMANIAQTANAIQQM
jgi:hypothetical protein